MADCFDVELPQLAELPDILSFDVNGFADNSLISSGTFFDDDNCVSSVVQVQKTQEKSPFHESDSGVSEVSDVLSPETDMDIGLMLDEVLDNMTVRPFLTGSDTDHLNPDKGPLGYFNGSDGGLTAETRFENEDQFETPLQSVHQTRSRSRSVMSTRKSERLMSLNDGSAPAVKISRDNDCLWVSQPKMNKVLYGAVKGRKERAVQGSGSSSASSSDIDDNAPVDIDSKRVSKRQPRGSVRVKQAGAVLPTAGADSTSTNCNVTSVKVLRVVSSSNGCSTEDDVAKALEDRNRKNAEMARQNRLKKKAYMENLEQEFEEGKKRIEDLEERLCGAEEERDSYKKEVEYLKAVLANQSALAGLLKNIPSTNGVSLSSSISRKRVADHDHSYAPMKKECRPSSLTAGVCLHVDNDNVSLEFCHHCAKMAKCESS